MKLLTTILLIALACVVVLFAYGAPQGGGLTWDNTATLARIQADEHIATQRLANQDADSERWHATLQWLIVAGVVATVVVVAGVTIRHHTDKRAEVQLAALPLLLSRPGSYLERIDGDWWVVDDARRELIQLERRLTG